MRFWWTKIQQSYWRHIASDWGRANHDLRQTNRSYSRLIAEARRKPKSHDEGESLYGDWAAEAEPEQDEVDRLLAAPGSASSFTST